MGYVDKSLKCVECGASFTFSASEQELFANRGYANEPKRCPDCREARKQQRGNLSGNLSGNRDSYGYQKPRATMYPAVCSSCGKDTQVPFQPRNGRPVYCSDCYAKVKPSTRF